jgi:hypothetical protein
MDLSQIIEEFNSILKYPVKVSKTIEIDGGHLIEIELLEEKHKFFSTEKELKQTTEKNLYFLLEKKLKKELPDTSKETTPQYKPPENSDGIIETLKNNFKEGKSPKEGVFIFYNDMYMLYHNEDQKSIVVSNKQGKVIEVLTGDTYTNEEVLKRVETITNNKNTTDPGEVNQLIFNLGYTESKFKDGLWVFKNPKSKKYVIHSEEERSLAVVGENDKIIKKIEKEDYQKEKIQKHL